MAIKSTEEYIDFFVNLNMGENVPLLSFVNNERMVLKQKLEYKNLEKEPIEKGIKILALCVLVMVLFLMMGIDSSPTTIPNRVLLMISFPSILGEDSSQ